MPDNAPMLSQGNELPSGLEPSIWPVPNCLTLVYFQWPQTRHWMYRGGIKCHLMLEHDQLIARYRVPLELPRNGHYEFRIITEPNIGDDPRLLPDWNQGTFLVNMPLHAPRGVGFEIVGIEKIYLWKISRDKYHQSDYLAGRHIVTGIFEFRAPLSPV